MAESRTGSFPGILVSLLVCSGFAWAGSQHGVQINGIPVFAAIVVGIFLLQWLIFLPSFFKRTEKFFDLTGSVTYLLAVILGFVLSEKSDARSLLLAAVVCIWALRLGYFLFSRIRKAGKDARFDQLKTSFSRFLLTWTLQGVWISITLGAALAAITGNRTAPLDGFFAIGLALWATGFVVEVVADEQKSRFKADPANKDRFIHTGLWAWSRHPNYFGEIVLWIGVAVIAYPVLTGWQKVTLISPAFVALLLLKISGVPLLEKRADEKWGHLESYQRYKNATPVLFPRPPKKR